MVAIPPTQPTRNQQRQSWAHPQPAATILATMPTDAALKNAWYHASQNHQATATIPGWGDAICFNELHHTTPYHNTWD